MKAYLTYALNKEGDLVHINSVPNGNDCGCFCPHCKSKLCAKNGGTSEKMIHHFAHQSGADCIGAIESALHKMAKDVISRQGKKSQIDSGFCRSKEFTHRQRNFGDSGNRFIHYM